MITEEELELNAQLADVEKELEESWKKIYELRDRKHWLYHKLGACGCHEVTGGWMR
jgi:hypothetical protein